ncbi:MAG: rRNA maturation RNase YbeY [Anaerolineae bacterium]|nr:rRNA maturation RNase YbeY [Anaerolineae bacterium]
MTSSIEIRVHPKFSSRVPRARLIRVARKTMRAQDASAALTIYITSDAEIRKLNRTFHATDAPTDVLAFPMHSAGHPRNLTYLGDVVISYERARVQARQAGWRIGDELDLLTVHGILHLLGYTDETLRARARMWRQQEKILGKPIPSPSSFVLRDSSSSRRPYGKNR